MKGRAYGRPGRSRRVRAYAGMALTALGITGLIVGTVLVVMRWWVG